MEGENNQQNQQPAQTQPQVQTKSQQVTQPTTNVTEVKVQQNVQTVVNTTSEETKIQEVQSQVPVQVQTKEGQKVQPTQIVLTQTAETSQTNESQTKNEDLKPENVQQEVKTQTQVLPQQQNQNVEVNTKVEESNQPQVPKQNQVQVKQEEIKQQEIKQEEIKQEEIKQQEIKQEEKVQVKVEQKKQQILEKPVVKIQKSQLDWELQKLTVTMFDQLKALQKSQKWQKYNDKPCPMFKIEIQSRIATKGIGIVNYPYDKVVQFLSDQTTLIALNPTCVECRVLYKKPNEDGVDIFRVNYMQYKATWPVANRQFINVGAKKSEGQGKFYIGTKKCNYPYPQDKKIVRGQVSIGGYIIQRIDEKSTRVTYISDADIKGSIPGMVKNMLAKSQGEVAAKIQGVMKQSEKKKKK